MSIMLQDIELFSTESTSQIKIYATSVCPKCKRLEAFLDYLQVPFEVMDMQSSEGMTDLTYNGIFVREAPVLKIGGTFYTHKELFTGTELRKDFIQAKLN